MKNISAHLRPHEFKLYMWFQKTPYIDFAHIVANVENKDEYGVLMNAVRKFKILGMPLPDYLNNLTDEEIPIFMKAREAMQKKISPDLDQLGDSEFYKLVMILFRGEVQYA